MYFGGVVAAMANSENAFQVTADAHREGGTYFSGPTR